MKFSRHLSDYAVSAVMMIGLLVAALALSSAPLIVTAFGHPAAEAASP